MNNGGTCVQTAVDTSDSNYHGCAIRRTIYGSRVFPWEWVNPPMVVGVEYRTTERYLSKPVYKKLQIDNIEYWSIDEGVTWKPKSYYVRDYQLSTIDLTAGSSALPDGTVYYVYE